LRNDPQQKRAEASSEALPPAHSSEETLRALPLSDGARLRHDEGACLPLRSDFGRCRACVGACPVRVLDVTIERVALAEGCLHCGRCVAACPTDALRLEGFELPRLPEGSGPLRVECAKVPAAQRASDGVCVPCLGGLSVGRLAALHDVAGARGVELIDRGWCGRCSAGGGEGNPVRGALEKVAMWLEALADPRPAPRLRTLPLPAELMPADIPPPRESVEEARLSRRQFFATLATDPTGRRRGARPMGGDGRAAFPASERRESPERRRLLDALDAAAERGGREVPSEFFPQVTSTGRCLDHRICSGACPTGALKVADAGGRADLTYDAATCIACGACARACPEGALAVREHGGERSPVVLATHSLRACGTCGETFTPRDGETVCMSCGKTQRFVGDAMSQLFGVRN
jgi:ferredoxin